MTSANLLKQSLQNLNKSKKNNPEASSKPAKDSPTTEPAIIDTELLTGLLLPKKSNDDEGTALVQAKVPVSLKTALSKYCDDTGDTHQGMVKRLLEAVLVPAGYYQKK